MFDELIVCYLFLGGAGAGACCVLSCMSLLVPAESVVASDGCARTRAAGGALGRYRNLFAPGYVVALTVLALGAVSLVADLGRFDRIMLLLVNPSSSYISVGAYALAICVVLAACLALAWSGYLRRFRLSVLRVLAALAAVDAFVVMVYAGLMLQSMRAVPLWTTPWLPVLFALSSLSCGIALVLGAMQLTGSARDFASVMRRAVVCDAAIIALEVLSVVLLVASLASQAGLDVADVARWLTGVPPSTSSADGTTTAAVVSLWQLLAGGDARLFWLGFALVGLMVPFVLDVLMACRSRIAVPLALAVVVCVLVGGCVMRLCIVDAGMHPVLSAFSIGR